MPRDAERPRGTAQVAVVGGVAIRVSFTTLVLMAILAAAVAPQVERVRPGLGSPAALVFGLVIGLLIYVAVLAHEGAHAVAARRHGRRVASITLSAFGGRTVVEGESASPREEFVTAALGPVVSLLLGGVALAVRLPLDDGLIALACEVLVLANLILGGLDLVPAPPLDGSRLVKALAWRISGSARTGAVAAAQCGRVVAVLLALGPLVLLFAGVALGTTDLIFASVIGALLWVLATADLDQHRLRRQVGAVVVRDVARDVIAVDVDLPLAEALRRGELAGARGIVTLDSAGQTVGVLSDRALDRIPPDRRAWVPTFDAARTLEADHRLPADITGDQLLEAIRRAPAEEYVLVDPAGAVVAVLSLRDLDRVVRGR